MESSWMWKTSDRSRASSGVGLSMTTQRRMFFPGSSQAGSTLSTEVVTPFSCLKTLIKGCDPVRESTVVLELTKVHRGTGSQKRSNEANGDNEGLAFPSVGPRYARFEWPRRSGTQA